MSVAVKYDLGESMLKALTDPGAAIEDLHNLALKLQGEVQAIDAAKTAEGERENVLASRYDKDEDGRKAAESFLRADGGPFDSIIDWIDEDPGRTYHALNAVKDLLVKYLTTECDYFRNMLTPKAAKVSRKGEFKSDFNEVRELIAHVAGMASGMGFDASTSEFLTLDSTGKHYKSVLAGFRGTRSSDDGTVTGRYAKVYSLAWVIDDEELEDGWTIPEIVRSLWHGPDRIGKNAKNLTDILDSVTEWTKPEFEATTFEVNGHTVTVSRTTTED